MGAAGASSSNAEKGAVADTGATSTSTSTASAADANGKTISRPVGLGFKDTTTVSIDAIGTTIAITIATT